MIWRAIYKDGTIINEYECGKEFNFLQLSKSQIDEIYPEEAHIYLKFVGFEQQYKELQGKIDYLQQCLDKINIQHADPKEMQTSFIHKIEQAQGFKIQLLKPNKELDEENELPDKEALHRLRQFREEHNMD